MKNQIPHRNRILRYGLTAVVGCSSLWFAAAAVGGPAIARAAGSCSVSWTGAGSNTFWTNAANWSTHRVPTRKSDVCITTSFTGFVSAVGTFAVHSLVLNSPMTLILGSSNQSGAMKIATSFTNSGYVNLEEATLTAAQIINTSSGGITSSEASTITSPAFSNAGGLAAVTGPLKLTDVPSNLSGGTLTGGGWFVAAGGTIDLPGNITALHGATVTLGDGPIIDSVTGADAFAGLTMIDATSQFAVDGPTAETIGGDLTNAGTLVLGGYDGAGTLTIGGTLNQVAGGSTDLSSGSFTAKQVNIGSGSNLSTNGVAFNANVQNSGFMEALIGGLTGNFAQTSTGTLLLNFHSPFAVSGTAALGGTLEVYTGFPPGAGATATIMTYASETGTFDNVQLGFQATVSSTSVQVTANPAVAVSPSNVAPGQSVSVSGANFGQFDSVTVYLDSVPLGTVRARRDGSFTTSVTIPNGTSPGTHTIVATGTSGTTAKTSLQVS